ncbi:MAG: hypothetical protein CH6_1757 [Candidatus Kapaibacterium sp.]|jgi:type III secretory pathway component EscR|nr:MAG: hypothetical protein CH6_1757 [Candidatus Kapabacteria bacterium]
MERYKFFSSEEKEILIEALRRLVNERKPIYDGYQKYLKKEIQQEEIEFKDKIKSKEGQ